MPLKASNPDSPPNERTLRARALRLLGRREYARREMAERLARWGATNEQAARVLDGLQADGLLSEQRYAESWIRTRLTAAMVLVACATRSRRPGWTRA